MIRPVDVIQKKRNGLKLSKSEISEFVKLYCSGEIFDYQMSALLMAIYFVGMDEEETANLTFAMIDSGRVLDLSELGDMRVDKHSTGGVGDKTSIILAPVVAEAGLFDPMMSGRGLGHTGGTLDKLESVAGYNVHLDETQVRAAIAQCGYAMFAQTDDIVPADKKMYALRDVTATVESIPLITASILSKKLAEGTVHLVMDVKYGSGAFMKKLEDAKALASSIEKTGHLLGLKIQTLITDMNEPLGQAVGNLLEMQECAKIMREGLGKNPISADLENVTVDLATMMIHSCYADKTESECRKMVTDIINSGRAYDRFAKNIVIQGGSLDSLWREISVKNVYDITADKTGALSNIDAYKFGLAGMCTGAGRLNVTDSIDYECGIKLYAKSGMSVNKGDLIARLFYNDDKFIGQAISLCNEGISIKQHCFH